MAKDKVRFLKEARRLRGPLYDKQGDRVVVGYEDRICDQPSASAGVDE